LLEHFADLPDPRAEPAKRHPLLNVLFIALAALLAGAEDFLAMEAFGHAKYAWLQERLDLSWGIPSHDTLGRVFAALDPHAFARCFVSWVEAIRTQVNAEIVPLDGKTLRHSFDTATGKAAIPVVSAWATKNRLVLGQVKVDDKSNEITAIPVLLLLLDLSGCILTWDAMGCQKRIATQITQQKGQYLLALKENHSALYQDVQALFEHAQQWRWENCPHDQCEQTDYAHARLETRCCSAVALVSLNGLWQDVQPQWSGVCSLVRIKSRRRLADKVTTQTRSYLSSLPADARRLLQVARTHWSIENRLHWVLDVAFDEEACRVRKEHAPQKLAILGHLALNLLGQEKTAKGP
jgi:predicted transposase YbfD/YdcC